MKRCDSDYEHLHTTRIDSKGVSKAKYKPIGANPASADGYFTLVCCVLVVGLVGLTLWFGSDLAL